MKSILNKVRGFSRMMIEAAKYTVADIYDRNDVEYENKRRLDDPLYLERYGYKVYSQNDEDGIIAEIFNRIGTTDKRFVEFGNNY